MDYQFVGKENKISAEHLQKGENVKVIGFGQSMVPILKSGQPVICTPVTEDTILMKKDIVLCKVNGHYYLHLIYAIRNEKQFLIGNNHGHMNGWVSRKNIYGKVAEIL